MSWFLIALKKYADFSGRARRKEYWFFVLFYLLMLLVIAIAAEFAAAAENALIVIAGVVFLGMLLPSIAVTVRRLHDIGRTGWWMLLYMIPLIGDIVMLVFAVTPSQPGENAYGPSPLDA
jgi:uncharacterized membrane protein YhaH (DUF805 family)